METKEIYILIYISGYLASYMLTKYVRFKNNKNDWGDIFATIIFSFFSWIYFLFALFIFSKKIFNNINIKPPKWL
jgi:uncharacterized BrkB/YihY/UPF0761 family membrane protein